MYKRQLYKFPASLLAIAAECISFISLIIFTLPAVSYVGTVIKMRDAVKCKDCGWIDDRKLSLDFGKSEFLNQD